jgi:AraC family transcriptional regulator
MQVQLVEREPIVLAGMSYYGPLTGEGWSRQNPIGQLWNRFNDFFDKMPSFSQDHALNPAVGYEISIWSEREFQESKCFYVFVGIEVDQLDDMPLELVGKVLPSSTYAHLIPKGQEITSWETTFYEEWLPGSGNKLAAHGGYNFQIQAYEEGRFKGLGELIEGSEIDVYVPVEKA